KSIFPLLKHYPNLLPLSFIPSTTAYLIYAQGREVQSEVPSAMQCPKCTSKKLKSGYRQLCKPEHLSKVWPNGN
ncbi:MAG: hypothetical protein AB8B99_18240, partial [Phormidesmis sp.]